ncbi:hypothetical protein AX16_004925 [Volvariella volvacea WC 439]|nr:hypothetical protein AX16_004925 [Volvariella volvacea WC 439]
MSKRKSYPGELANTQDELAIQDLQDLGYKQELSRSRGLFHILFMTLTIMAVPFGVSAPIATSLIGGGPATIIWSWVFVSVITQPLALSLSEICSKYPTSAGAYYWCFRLSSPRYRLIFSWITGWLVIVGVWTISLSVNFGTAQLLIAAVGIFHPEWEATTWQTYLIFLAITFFSLIIGIFFGSLMPLIDILSAVWTLLGIIVTVVAISVKAAAGRHSAKYALGHFDPSASGWNPTWTFFIGSLPAGESASSRLAYTYSAIGMITSMAEEVHDPSIQVPQAMTWSIPIGAIMGLVYLLPIVFTLPDVETLLAVASGQPIGVMFELIMGSKSGGFGLTFIILIIGVFCSISICCAASRSTWSFARDKALPFHQIFSKVNTSLGPIPLASVPVNAYLLSTTIQILLGLIYFGSTAAFNAFVGVAVMCLGASYAMPIALSLANGRRQVVDARFSLGKWGWALNVVAVLWVGFEMVLFSMPVVIPVTPVTMNYASVVFFGFAVISAVWYTIDGRYHYTGPSIPQDLQNTPSNQSDVFEAAPPTKSLNAPNSDQAAAQEAHSSSTTVNG